MKNRINAATLSFMGVYWFYWLGIAAYLPYLVPYLKSCGYNEIQIGILTSAMSVVSIAGPVFWGAVQQICFTLNIYMKK